MKRIVFLERDTVRAEMSPLNFPHEWREYAETNQSQVIERLRGAHIAIINKTKIGAPELAELPELELVAVAATGLNTVDVEACRARGVAVSNVVDYSTDAVAEHVLLLMLALRRNLPAYLADVRRGAWAKSQTFGLFDHSIIDLRGSTLGLIGYGAIGRAVEKLAQAFGMSVLVAERKTADAVRAGRVDFFNVLRESDVLTVHTPLNEETRGMIAKAELALMKETAILINCARGGVVDEQALADALQGGKLAGAGVDVLTEEPPAHGNPLLELDLPSLIVTPHNAWASRTTMQNLATEIVANIEAFARGERRNRIV